MESSRLVVSRPFSTTFLGSELVSVPVLVPSTALEKDMIVIDDTQVVSRPSERILWTQLNTPVYNSVQAIERNRMMEAASALQCLSQAVVSGLSDSLPSPCTKTLEHSAEPLSDGVGVGARLSTGADVETTMDLVSETSNGLSCHEFSGEPLFEVTYVLGYSRSKGQGRPPGPVCTRLLRAEQFPSLNRILKVVPHGSYGREDGRENFVPQKIYERRRSKESRGPWMYLIEWQGYPKSEDFTWQYGKDLGVYSYLAFQYNLDQVNILRQQKREKKRRRVCVLSLLCRSAADDHVDGPPLKRQKL
jgi:hypothetical protein